MSDETVITDQANDGTLRYNPIFFETRQEAEQWCAAHPNDSCIIRQIEPWVPWPINDPINDPNDAGCLSDQLNELMRHANRVGSKSGSK
jgi:hypothetical protein